jgi:hypothetical protein
MTSGVGRFSGTAPPSSFPRKCVPILTITTEIISRARARAALEVVVAIVALVSAIGVSAVWSSPAGATGPGPTMSISPAAITPGQTVFVSVDGWPTGPVSATVCGDAARRGDDDCDLTGARSFDVGADGSGSSPLTAVPPVACPCVVRVGTPDGGLVQTLPLQVSGTDPATPPGGSSAGAGQLEVSARLRRDPWSPVAAFGVTMGRTLEVTIGNVGAAPVEGLSLAARVGRDGSSGHALPEPAVQGVLRPGEQQIVTISFELPAPVVGGYVVTGEVLGLDQPVGFRATTSSQPWGLAAVVLAALFGVFGWWLGRRRRRVDAAASDPSTEGRRAPDGREVATRRIPVDNSAAALSLRLRRRYRAAAIDPLESLL